MAEVLLDDSQMTSPDDFYSQFFAQAGSVMPDYGGRNLDALHDDLRELDEPLTVVWQFTDQARHSLGEWFDKVISVFEERDPGNQPVIVVLR